MCPSQYHTIWEASSLYQVRLINYKKFHLCYSVALLFSSTEQRANSQITGQRSIKMTDWKHGLFGCLSNCDICLCGYCCPCILGYRNAENLGKEGLLYGLLYFVVPCVPCESYNYKGYPKIRSFCQCVNFMSKLLDKCSYISLIVITYCQNKLMLLSQGSLRANF